MRSITVTFALAFFFVIALLVFGGDESSGHYTQADPYHWHKNRQASYYNPTGNPTACGNYMGWNSRHVAALKREYARCGMKVTICHRRRCVKVRVKDRGAWRYDRRDWDLAVQTKRDLRCSDLCTVRWKRGWS